MTTATAPGQRWRARADDWAAIQEWTARPVYDAVLDELSPWPGTTLLDLGCGSGGFASLAAARGAQVAGVDTAADLIEIAERRVSTGAFRVGSLAKLPYADASFAVVSAINSFQYAVDPAAALAEAVRVTRPGGALVAAVWSPAEECDAAAYAAVLGCETAGPFRLSEPGVLEDLAASAGLRPGRPAVVACPWQYHDEETALRGLLSSDQAAAAIDRTGEAAVTAAVQEAIAPYRRDDGSYLLGNAVRYVVVRV